MIVALLMYLAVVVLFIAVGLMSYKIMSTSFSDESRRSIGVGVIAGGLIAVVDVLIALLSGAFGVLELALLALVLTLIIMLGVILTSKKGE